MSTKQYSLAVLLVVITILGSFYSGYFLKDTLQKEEDAKIENTASSKLPLPYFTDQIIFITKDTPHKAFYAFATRFSRDWETYTHRQRVYYYDGVDWSEDFDVTTSENYLIAPTSVINKWDVIEDPSLVLKQSVEGLATIYNNQIEFNLPLIENEMGVRSLNSYTVFRSETQTKIKINGNEHEAYVLYDRTYSFNADIRLVAPSETNKISTDWIAFWDEEGNFYNADETIVTKSQDDPYKSHSIAILKDNQGKINKSFDLTIDRLEDKGFKIDIGSEADKTINATISSTYVKNSQNSSVNNKIGTLNGYVQLSNGKIIRGIGFYEYIDQ